MIDWTEYSNFSRTEFECRCGCEAADMDPDFMAKLQALRDALGFSMPISSGYRCAGHNRAVGGGPAHNMGRAADIAVAGNNALKVVSNASLYGMTGVGIQQSGPISGRFIHFDDLPANMRAAPRPWIWSYT